MWMAHRTSPYNGFAERCLLLTTCLLLLTIPGTLGSSSPDPDTEASCGVLSDTQQYRFECTNGNAHMSTCNFKCKHTGFSVCSGATSSWTCDNGDWGGNVMPTCCDTQAPSITCPLSITIEAPRGTVSATVSWNLPTYSDNSGICNLQRLSGGAPGSTFPEGRHTIEYKVKDNAQNTASCSFTVTVKVNRCDSLNVARDELQMSCNRRDKFIYGSTCLFSCSSGWDLDGERSITCENQGTSSSPDYKWTGQKPTCKPTDSDPPLFENQPTRIVLYAQERSYEALVDYHWEPVKAVDDISGEIEADLIAVDGLGVSIYNPIPTVFAEGVHTLSYAADDDTGNRAVLELEFAVEVLRCDISANIDGATMVCAHANLLGSTCLLSCEQGLCLIGDSTVTCANVGNSTHPITQWTWDGEPPFCQEIQCPPLGPPTNGFLVNGNCATDYGYQCDIDCDTGYSLVSGQRQRQCQTQSGAGCDGGFWTGEHPQCADNEPPVIYAPDSIVIIAEPKETHGSIDYSWEPIQAFDTASGATQTTLISINGHAVQDLRPSIFTEGFHGLEYEAVDENGNRALKTIQLIVIVTRCTWPAYFTSNGTIFCDTPDYILGTTCVVQCNSGYCYESTDMMTCLPSMGSSELGQWSSSELPCIQPQCPDLIPPSSGYVLSGEESCSGSQCQMACDDTFEALGDTQRQCNVQIGTACSDAFWDGQPLHCRATTCPALGNKSPALISGCQSDTAMPIGTVCQWFCPSGYRAAGSSISNCLMNGSWDITDFTCEEITCSALDIPGTEFTPTSCSLEPSTAGTFCQQNCTTPGFELQNNVDGSIAHDFIKCTDTGDWLSIFGLDFNAPECIDIERPQFTDCPPLKIIYTEKYFLVAHLIKMNAVDNSGVTPDVACDFQEGLVPEGVYTTTCTATDNENNLATCTSMVMVTVRRCQPIVLPIHGVLDSQVTCADYYGGQCGITCEYGYVLQGSSRAMCEYDQTLSQTYWAWDEQPSCQAAATVCPSFEEQLPSDVSLQCSASNDVGSICTFSCTRTGYVITGVTDRIVCGSDGSWNTDVIALNQTCQDIQPPVVTSCPDGPIEAELANTSPPQAQVFFNIPLASDNSDLPLRIEITPSDVTLPYYVQTDTLITYQFYDGANNSAPCSFQVNVINYLPPTILQCPSILSFDSTNDVTWNLPDFENPVTGVPIIPVCDRQPGDAFLAGEHTVTCTATNPDNGVPSQCTFVINVAGCPVLPPPENGNWVCLKNTCDLECNKGYGVRHGLPKHFTCGDNGWLPPASLVPVCKQTGPAIIAQTSDAYFGTDVDCTNDQVKEGIANDFRGFVEQSAAESRCSGTCDLIDLQVTCKPSAARRKRSNRLKIFTFCYRLGINVDEGTPVDATNELQTNLETLSNTVSAKIRHNEFHASNATMLPTNGDNGVEVEVGPALVVCRDEGRVLVDGVLSCVFCEDGRHERDGECVCPPGTRESEDHTQCIETE